MEAAPEHATENDVGIEPGDLIADRYRVVRVIGRGGMGLILEAMHEALSRHGHGKAYPSTIAHRQVIAAIRKFAATELRIASEKRGTLPAVDRAG